MNASDPDRSNMHKDLLAYERLAQIAQALSSPLRLELLELLAQAPRRVDDLAQTCQLSVQTTSHHLQRLRAAGLVSRRAEGREGVYSLANEAVTALWTHLENFARGPSQGLRRPTEAPQTMTAASSPITSLEREGRVTLIDVRPPQEYAAGHLPNALSLPLEEIERRLHEIPRDKLVVAVCRGTYCQLADAAVGILQQQGFEAVRFAQGILEWRGAGGALVQDDAPTT